MSSTRSAQPWQASRTATHALSPPSPPSTQSRDIGEGTQKPDPVGGAAATAAAITAALGKQHQPPQPPTNTRFRSEDDEAHRLRALAIENELRASRTEMQLRDAAPRRATTAASASPPRHISLPNVAPIPEPRTKFVPPPADLLSSLRDGPSRKRKRDHDDDDPTPAGRTKRKRWEDAFDNDTLEWLQQIRRLALDAMQDRGKLQLENEELVREVDRMREALAEDRWTIRVLRGLDDDMGNARLKFLAEEIDRLRHPPPRDDSKRYDMYGDTDLSDAYDSDDMNVRSELDEDEERAYGNGDHIGYDEWQKRSDERTRSAGPSRSRIEPRDTAPSSFRPPTSPPRHRSSPRQPSPPRHPPHSRSDGPPVARRSGKPHINVSAPPDRASQAVSRKERRMEPAESMDEVDVVGTIVEADDDDDAPDLNDADADHALAAAERDHRTADSRTRDGLEEISLDAIVARLPKANLDAALREAVWNVTDGFRTPMPLGRYGHPYRAKWRWGDIDPRRIFKDSSNGSRLAKDSHDFKQLAQEAVTLPFAARSVTQRVVVGWAHRDGILPMAGWQPEPDVAHEVRSNPARISSAVRRRNTVNRDKLILYTEWDLVDFDCHLLMRVSRPRQQQRELKLQSGREWKELVWKALEYGWRRRCSATFAYAGQEDDDDGGETLAGFDAVQEYENGPQPYAGDGSKKSCARLEETEMGAFLTRINTHEQQRQALIDELAAKHKCKAQDLDEDVKKSYLTAHIVSTSRPPTMPLQSRPLPVACQVEQLNGHVCGLEAPWFHITRTTNGMTFLVAMCKTHSIVAVFVSMDGVIFFKWATDDFIRDLIGLAGRSRARRIADRCTRCLGRVNVGCTNHMCKTCCNGGEFDCKLSDHRIDKQRPMNPVRRLSDYIWHALPAQEDAQGEAAAANDENDDARAAIASAGGGGDVQWIIFDSEDEDACGQALAVARAPAQQGPSPEKAGPSRPKAGLSRSLPAPAPKVIKIDVGCEHTWEGNAARDSGVMEYRTVVTVPASRGIEGGEFMLSDFTPEALAALKLTRKLTRRLLIWHKGSLRYLLAFPGKKDDPADPKFSPTVKYNAKHRISFQLPNEQDEIERHVPLLSAEQYKGVNLDWHTLKAVLVHLEVIRFAEGHCKGRMQTVYVDCKARHRRFDIEQCMVSLSDLGVETLVALDLLEADLSLVDDGTDRRPNGITLDTPLDARPYGTDYDKHELMLTIRVHGAKIAPPKRLRVARSADGEEGESEDAERPSKRRKTAV
ncbi:hypothetical protein AURDEDRAFT_166202 [Auricularia subglabra TFB-10046 SS5]|nr:hypothetical protein AURDEDRAFT_166202 [Auricularia subglabra TFB-10046 SS5]